jgi:ribulose-phosphate 3-epimerase
MVVQALKPCTSLPVDVHLMVSPVDVWLPQFAAAGADILTVHPESGAHLHRSVQAIRALGKRAGVALNPATPPEAIDYVLGDIDMVLVMSVNPGFGGQAFIASQLDKIRAVRRRIDAAGRNIRLQVDGGVNAETARSVVEAGADVLVAGSAVFAGGAGAYGDNIRRLRAG